MIVSFLPLFSSTFSQLPYYRLGGHGLLVYLRTCSSLILFPYVGTPIQKFQVAYKVIKFAHE